MYAASRPEASPGLVEVVDEGPYEDRVLGLTAPSSGAADDDDRARRVVDAVLAHRPQESLDEPAVPAVSDHQQVRFLRLVQQCPRGVVADDSLLHGSPRPQQNAGLFNRLPQLAFRLGGYIVLGHRQHHIDKGRNSARDQGNDVAVAVLGVP